MEGESLSIVHEAMSMLRVIVAFGRESHEYGRFREQAESTVDARVKLTVRQTLFSLAVSMITAAGTALVLGVGAWHVLQGQLTVGELLVVMGYIAAVYQPLEQISLTLGSLQEQFIGLRGALDLLEIKPEVTEHPDAVTLRNVRGEVVFDSVSFQLSGATGGAQGCLVPCRSGPTNRDRRADGGREEHARQPGYALLRPRSRERCGSTASIFAS